MITSYDIGSQIGDLTIPMEFFELIHNLSMYLLLDDRLDVGHFAYTGRQFHYYHGKHSPDHPSIHHHWTLAVAGLIFSEVGSVVNKGVELFKSYQTIESGDLSSVDQSIIDLVEEDNTVSLDDFEKEVAIIPSYPQHSKKMTYQVKNRQNHSQKIPLAIPKPSYLPVSASR